MPIPKMGPSSPLFQFLGGIMGTGNKKSKPAGPLKLVQRESCCKSPAENLDFIRKKAEGSRKGTLKEPGQLRLPPQGHLRTCWCRV